MPYDNDPLIRDIQVPSLEDVSIKNILSASAARNRKYDMQIEYIFFEIFDHLSYHTKNLTDNPLLPFYCPIQCLWYLIRHTLTRTVHLFLRTLMKFLLVFLMRV